MTILLLTISNEIKNQEVPIPRRDASGMNHQLNKRNEEFVQFFNPIEDDVYSFNDTSSDVSVESKRDTVKKVLVRCFGVVEFVSKCRFCD